MGTPNETLVALVVVYDKQIHHRDIGARLEPLKNELH